MGEKSKDDGEKNDDGMSWFGLLFVIFFIYVIFFMPGEPLGGKFYV